MTVMHPLKNYPEYHAEKCEIWGKRRDDLKFPIGVGGFANKDGGGDPNHLSTTLAETLAKGGGPAARTGFRLAAADFSA
jgi:hypothetical protein